MGRSRWNPAVPAKVSPEQFERRVVAWLKRAGQDLSEFRVTHLKHLSGEGGDYEFDAVVELNVLSGARIVVLIECKRYSRPVEREKVLALWAKLQSVSAHKAMVFSTGGFQRGALEFASAKNIATVVVMNRQFLYETKSAIAREPPADVELQAEDCAGVMLTDEGETLRGRTLMDPDVRPLADWLNDSRSAGSGNEPVEN